MKHQNKEGERREMLMAKIKVLAAPSVIPQPPSRCTCVLKILVDFQKSWSWGQGYEIWTRCSWGIKLNSFFQFIEFTGFSGNLTSDLKLGFKATGIHLWYQFESLMSPCSRLITFTNLGVHAPRPSKYCTCTEGCETKLNQKFRNTLIFL